MKTQKQNNSEEKLTLVETQIKRDLVKGGMK